MDAAVINKVIPFIGVKIKDFEKRWGIEPAGILMHPVTFAGLKVESKKYDSNEPTFKGIKIYTSDDVNVLEIRFVL